MDQHQSDQVSCSICGQHKTLPELVPAAQLRPALLDTIRAEHPELSADGLICLDDLNHYRTQHIREILEHERGELSALENEVARSMADQELISRNVNDQFVDKLTLGERIADKVATFGGSWRFIIIFSLIIVVWIFTNVILLATRAFDPYPFILLNLLLSCLAAIQAPIIMMSQNRQEAKDRLRSEHDYKVNLKAELEIQHLNEKLDHLITRQWQNLLETQQMEMEMLDEIMKREDKRE